MPEENAVTTPRLDQLIEEMKAAGRSEDDTMLNLAKGMQEGLADIKALLKGDEEEIVPEDVDQDQSDTNQMKGEDGEDGDQADAEAKARAKAKATEDTEDEDPAPGMDDLEKGVTFDVTSFVLGLEEQLGTLNANVTDLSAQLAKAQQDNAELRKLLGGYIKHDIAYQERLTKAVVHAGLGIEQVNSRPTYGGESVATATLRHKQEEAGARSKPGTVHKLQMSQLAKARQDNLIQHAHLSLYRKTGKLSTDEAEHKALFDKISAISFE